MKFEWDEAEAAANLEKHGVSFDTAARGIDEDSARLDTPDTRFEYGESRTITLAEVDGLLLAIVHTARSNRTRIISARRANRHERQTYDEAEGEEG